MIYTDGTIAIKAGSPIVTGTGTQWKKNIHGVAPGQLISIENGTAPVSMMIRAVNSDTELVLSFNAPVTLSGAKYSIATTVPDTISDAARTMSANQGYIVYFLQAMQQWMTDTGKVEIELPNGQKVTLDSIKSLNDAIANAKPGDATTTQKGVVQLSAAIGTSTTKVPHEKAVSDALSKKADTNKLGTAAGKNTGTSSGDVMEVGAFGLGGGVGEQMPGNDFNAVNKMGFYAGEGLLSLNPPNPEFSYGILQHMQRYVETHAAQLSYYISGIKYRYRQHANQSWGPWFDILTSNKYTIDGNGFYKRASPVIAIHPDGSSETNDESEGAEVHRTGTGQYHITGILGYNSDGAWGVNGGISVPKDNNGLELVYVDDRVQEDGSLIIETCHRQHAHLPERFQNWRLKEVTPEGERIFYQDGEPCDLPKSTRLDVRVEMPQGSVWNVKQRELAEQMEREQAEREAQEAADPPGDSEE